MGKSIATVRISFGAENTEQDAVYIAKAIAKILIK